MPRIDFAQMPTQVSGPPDLHAHPQLFDALPLAVLVCDREGRLVNGNAGARELWGDALEPGVHTDDLLSPSPDGNGLTTTPTTRVLASGEALHGVNLRVTGRAGAAHASATIAPLRDGGGEIVGAICSLLRQPDQQLQSDLEDFFTHASVPMHLVGADGRILRANRAELELLGYSPEEYIGRHIATFHADQAALDEILCRLHAGERLEQFPARLRARDGTIKEVLISSSPRFVDGRFSNTRCVTTDVTEQRRLDREARESERLLHELMNALPVAIYTTDADGRITFFNEASAQFAGRRPALGDMWCVTWKLFHPDGRPLPHDQCPMAVALREQRSVRGEEAVAERPDGSRITFVPYPTPLFDRQGTLVGAINTLVDVTDRKQGEQALRDLNEALEEHVRERTQQAQDAFLRLHRSERSLALLVDSVVDYAIYMLDLDGHVISWNAGAERIKGYRAGEITGRSFGCFYTHEDRRAGMPHRALQRARQEGRYAAEGWRVRKDGSRFWASVIIDPVYDAGELVGYAKVTRDVTEKRKTERALTESERRARGVIDTALDAFAQLDDKGTILEWNPCAESMYGWRRDDVLGRELATLIFAPPEQLLFRQCLPDRLSLPPGGKQPRQIKSRRRDGTELIVEVTSSVLRLDQGRLFNVFLRDLTEKIQIESQLRQAQKMEAVGKLTGGIAHDFNNLLQGIIGSLELVHLRVQSGRNDQVQKLLEGAGESASRAAALTHRLLAFSRRQPLDPRPVDINPLVASMEELLRRSLGEQIGLDLVVEADALHVLCDPNQLENALLNLCINARDAMPAGGRLTIRTGETILAPGDPRLAASADLAPGRYVHLEVADTGIGMTADIIEHVFEPFFTTKPAGQGTGLGLSMVYGFTRQSKGHCEIHSAPDKGTRVRLLLPCHVTAEPIGDGPAPLRASPRLGNGEAVLVVEDDAVVRQVVVQVLQTLGYVAMEAADAERATDLLASHPIDLLISDIGLPGLGGRQLADAARQAQPGIKVLLMTGYAADAASPAGFLGPGMELITKPFTTEAFGNRVRDMLSPA